jgi:hypothetical protein
MYVARAATGPAAPSKYAAPAPCSSYAVGGVDAGALAGYAAGPGAVGYDGCSVAGEIGSQYCRPPIVWGAGAGPVFLYRDDSNHEFFSYDSAIETNQYLNARNAYDDLLPGIEAHIVRFNMCTMTGIEGVYWGLFPSDATTEVDSMAVTGDLNAILNFDQLDYNGSPASAYVNDALVHRLRGTTEIHNVEVNRLWGLPSACGCSPWTMQFLAGFRYFNFNEGLQFAADTEDTMFTGDPDELYYTIDCSNNLYGGQLGGYAERCLARRWTARFGAKAGVFANDASAVSHIGGAAGTATINNGPNLGREWYVASNKVDAAFIGELHAGLGFQATHCWRVLADYRVVAASGVALPTNQIFHDLRGLQDVELLATNGTLLLHGVFVGAQLAY